MTPPPSDLPDLGKLRELAEKASRGNWSAYITSKRSPEIFTDGPTAHSPNPMIAKAILRKDDARFIAAANPAAILSLLTHQDALADRIAKLEGERERLHLLICGGEDAPGYAASLTFEQVEQAFRDNDRLIRDIADHAASELTTLREKVKAVAGPFAEAWSETFGSANADDVSDNDLFDRVDPSDFRAASQLITDLSGEKG